MASHDLDTLPTCTDGSLGAPKADAFPRFGRDYQTKADEWNTATACLEDVCAIVGTNTGYASTSLQARADHTEIHTGTAARWGYETHFPGAFDNGWAGSGDCDLATVPVGGVVAMPTNGAADAICGKPNPYFSTAGTPAFDFDVCVVDPFGGAGTECRLGVFNDSASPATSTDAYGIKCVNGVNGGNWTLFCVKDSAETAITTGVAPSQEGWQNLSLWVECTDTSVYKLRASIDGGATVELDTELPVDKMFGEAMFCDNGGPAGIIYIDRFHLDVDLSKDIHGLAS